MLTIRYDDLAGAFTEADLDGSLFHPIFADSFSDPVHRGYVRTYERIIFTDVVGTASIRAIVPGNNLGDGIDHGGVLTATSHVVHWYLGYGAGRVMAFDFDPAIPRQDGDGPFPTPIFTQFDTLGATIIGNVYSNFLQGRGAGDRLIGNGGNDVLNGLGAADRLFAGVGNDILRGGVGDDLLFGDAGDDYLAGGTQNDYLAGGLGADRMAGGPGRDVFAFESAVAARGDAILDFAHGLDRIDLRGIDADPGSSGDQAFHFIGKGGFTGAGAELRYRDGNLTADLDGDGLRDFHLTVADNPALTAADFLL